MSLDSVLQELGESLVSQEESSPLVSRLRESHFEMIRNKKREVLNTEVSASQSAVRFWRNQLATADSLFTSLRFRLQLLRTVFSDSVRIHVTQAKRQLWMKSIAGMADVIRSAREAAVSLDCVNSFSAKEDMELSADEHLQLLFERLNDDGGGTFSLEEPLPENEMAQALAMMAASALPEAADGVFAQPKRVLVVRGDGGLPAGALLPKDAKKRVGVGASGALEALKTAAIAIVTETGFSRQMPDRTVELPLFPPAHQLDIRVLGMEGRDGRPFPQGDILYCLDEFVACPRAYTLGVPSTLSLVRGSAYSATASVSFPESKSLPVLQAAQGSYESWTVCPAEQVGIVLATPTGGIRPLRFRTACVQHLLSTVFCGRAAALLPPAARRSLDIAYPSGTVLDGGLARLWLVRDGRLTAVSEAGMHELFLAYIARMPPLQTTPFAAVHEAIADRFVSLIPSRRPTAKLPVSTQPFAIVQFSAPAPSSMPDPPRLCGAAGCSLAAARGWTLCDLHYCMLRSLHRAPVPAPRAQGPVVPSVSKIIVYHMFDLCAGTDSWKSKFERGVREAVENFHGFIPGLERPNVPSFLPSTTKPSSTRQEASSKSHSSSSASDGLLLSDPASRGSSLSAAAQIAAAVLRETETERSSVSPSSAWRPSAPTRLGLPVLRFPRPDPQLYSARADSPPRTTPARETSRTLSPPRLALSSLSRPPAIAQPAVAALAGRSESKPRTEVRQRLAEHEDERPRTSKTGRGRKPTEVPEPSPYLQSMPAAMRRPATTAEKRRHKT